MLFLGDYFVEAAQGVERARITYVGQQLGDGGDEGFLAVAHCEVTLYVGFHLWIAAAKRNENGEGEQFACSQVETLAGVVVAKTVC